MHIAHTRHPLSLARHVAGSCVCRASCERNVMRTVVIALRNRASVSQNWNGPWNSTGTARPRNTYKRRLLTHGLQTYSLSVGKLQFRFRN
eukprot:6392869-Prymnesium_polylepis.1